MSKLHISLDDTKGIFKYLIAKQPESIFETRTLGFLKEMHERYGTEFTLYCTCTDGDFHLKNVSDRYKQEFLQNKDWLQFGFHTYSEELDYNKIGISEMCRHYVDTIENLKRITGHDECARLIRIHRFAASKEMCMALKDFGVCGLLTADDDRKSYYLTQSEIDTLNCAGTYQDKTCGLVFYKSLVRLEYAKNILREMEKRALENWEVIPVFTHEWQMDSPFVREQMEEVCKWNMRHVKKG